MLRCEECGKQVLTDVEAHGWRAYLTHAEGDESREVVVLCPDCAEREFGEDVEEDVDT
jgi:hypothetical protein